MATAARSGLKLRAQIAQMAAKLIASEGVADFRSAKRKAAMRLGIDSERNLPTNVEIEQALQEYQRLFQSRSQPDHLRALRRTALQAMEFLEQFRPRLVGAVLLGTATEFSDITLHLYCDAAEDVAWFLSEAGIKFEQTSRTIKTAPGKSQEFPALCFIAGEIPVVLVLFTETLEAIRPLSPVDGKPMRRATLARFKNMVEGDLDYVAVTDD
jgi:hypothetical protein